jgi:hypothetical protein
MNTRQVILTGLVLGLTAAVVVWWLERFELNRLHGEVRHYLANVDAFRAWTKERGYDDDGS